MVDRLKATTADSEKAWLHSNQSWDTRYAWRQTESWFVMMPHRTVISRYTPDPYVKIETR